MARPRLRAAVPPPLLLLAMQPCSALPPPAAAHPLLRPPFLPSLLLQVFLYPIGGVAVLVPLAVLAGANPTRLWLGWYFSYAA